MAAPDRSVAYADYAEGSFSWNFIERPAFDRALNDEQYDDTRILDIGSGPGRVINYHVARGASPANITGVEPDPVHVTKTQSDFPEAKFITDEIQNVDLPTGTYDLVTAQLSLRYLDNDELVQVLRQVRKSLKIGGLFFMLDVHPARYGLSDGFDRYFEESRRQVDTPWGGSEEYSYRTLATYMNSVLAAGLTVIHLDECPIAEAGKQHEDYPKYSGSPARFAIVATRDSV